MTIYGAREFKIGEVVRICTGINKGREGKVIETGSNWVNVETDPIEEVYRQVRVYIPAHGDICKLNTNTRKG